MPVNQTLEQHNRTSLFHCLQLFNVLIQRSTSVASRNIVEHLSLVKLKVFLPHLLLPLCLSPGGACQIHISMGTTAWIEQFPFSQKEITRLVFFFFFVKGTLFRCDFETGDNMQSQWNTLHGQENESSSTAKCTTLPEQDTETWQRASREWVSQFNVIWKDSYFWHCEVKRLAEHEDIL